TLTGHAFEDAPAAIADADEATLRAVWEYVEGLAAPAQAEKPTPAPTTSGLLSDEDVLALARAAANAPKFLRLWAGDTTGYGDDASRADLALASLLSFYTQDRAQLDRLVRRSGLMRPKWDEKRGAQTYGERTVE